MAALLFMTRKQAAIELYKDKEVIYENNSKDILVDMQIF